MIYLVSCHDINSVDHVMWELHYISLLNTHKEIDGLVQERRNSSALAKELRLSCINPSIWYMVIAWTVISMA